MCTVGRSDEHAIGTKLGVFRSRAISQLPEGQRHDTMCIGEVQGAPWRPSTRHNGDKSRTFIPENEDGSHEYPPDDEQDLDDFKFCADDDPGEDARIKQVAETQHMLHNRQGANYSFYIKARDVAKYAPTIGCPGCKYILGQVQNQCGHSPICKRRMMDLIRGDKEDKEDKHRVRGWCMEKGIDETNDDSMEKKDESDEMQVEEAPSQGTTIRRPAAAVPDTRASARTK